ncbi:uncharacterized protein LOC105227852 isoform X1 [Bactrocera dorsalis]|uniref:Uncharacterized protein LOC105227852 isoform X1 n=1 Tax=Bactrocera dorsalis TaxID=27457 RepID=A0ABM3JAF5_BACDO|nr:uncharacterized protein LOC105227852 isoform X1 [Bactrocera dorsalis]
MGSIDRACISGFLCRLCSEMHRIVIHIYGDQGRKLCLVEKINGYLPITISPTDPLPKTICETCLRRVEQHYDLLMRLTRIKQGNFPKIKKFLRLTLLAYLIGSITFLIRSNSGGFLIFTTGRCSQYFRNSSEGIIRCSPNTIFGGHTSARKVWKTQQALRTIGDVSSTDVSDDEHFDLTTISQEGRNSISDTNVQLSTDVSSQSSLIGTMQATTEYNSSLP